MGCCGLICYVFFVLGALVLGFLKIGLVANLSNGNRNKKEKNPSISLD